MAKENKAENAANGPVRQGILISAEGYAEIEKKLEMLKRAKNETVDLEDGADFLKGTENDITEKNLIISGQKNSLTALHVLNCIFHSLIIDNSPVIIDSVRIGSKVSLEISGSDNSRKPIVIKKIIDGYPYNKEVITTSSPLGAKIINRNKGDIVSYQAEGGVLTAKILSID